MHFGLCALLNHKIDCHKQTKVYCIVFILHHTLFPLHNLLYCIVFDLSQLAVSKFQGSWMRYLSLSSVFFVLSDLIFPLQLHVLWPHAFYDQSHFRRSAIMNESWIKWAHQSQTRGLYPPVQKLISLCLWAHWIKNRSMQKYTPKFSWESDETSRGPLS